MMLLAHIVIALASVAYTTYLFFSPSLSKMRFAEGLVLLTLASGTYVAISTHSNMLQACVSGLVYIAIVSVGLVAARQKLVAIHSK
jgi:multisubunit Na+/H+ antiporter MnhE subunit